MKKSNSRVGVSKTLVRNCEQKLKQPRPFNVSYETEQRDSVQDISGSAKKENDLSQPTLCSSESLANYLADIKKSLPPPLSHEEVSFEREAISEKITKKLNFHFNDKIYKNLVELNSEIPEVKTRNDRRLSSRTITKRDLEPNIEDFYEDRKEIDIPLQMPVVKPKFKSIRRSDKGYLHKLVAQFDL